MNERFRSTCDDMLLRALDELEIPYHVIGGTVPERLTKIVTLFGLPTVLSIDESIALASEEYSKVDWRLEKERTQSAAAAAATAAAV
jgi:hypothetical protein